MKEARDRVVAAFLNSGYLLPPRRLTVSTTEISAKAVKELPAWATIGKIGFESELAVDTTPRGSKALDLGANWGRKPGI